MADTPTPDALAAEFDTFMVRAGITIPPERRGAVLAAYADIRDQMNLLRGRYSHLNEPSNIFRLEPRR